MAHRPHFVQIKGAYLCDFIYIWLLNFCRWIVRNVFLAIQGLINAVQLFGLSFEHPDSDKMSEIICRVDCWSVEQFEPPSILQAIKTLWESEPAIRECYNRR